MVLVDLMHLKHIYKYRLPTQLILPHHLIDYRNRIDIYFTNYLLISYRNQNPDIAHPYFYSN